MTSKNLFEIFYCLCIALYPRREIREGMRRRTDRRRDDGGVHLCSKIWLESLSDFVREPEKIGIDLFECASGAHIHRLSGCLRMGIENILWSDGRLCGSFLRKSRKAGCKPCRDQEEQEGKSAHWRSDSISPRVATIERLLALQGCHSRCLCGFQLATHRAAW